MFNVDEMKRVYPGMFPPTDPIGIIIGLLIIASLFIIPYLYIRFLEDKVIAFLGNRLIPFIEFRLRMKKIIDIVHQILEMPIFGKSKII